MKKGGVCPGCGMVFMGSHDFQACFPALRFPHVRRSAQIQSWDEIEHHTWFHV